MIIKIHQQNIFFKNPLMFFAMYSFEQILD